MNLKAFELLIHVKLLQKKNIQKLTKTCKIECTTLSCSTNKLLSFNSHTKMNFLSVVWWKFRYSYQFVVGLRLFIFFMHRFSQNSWCLFWHFLLHTHIPSQLLIIFLLKAPYLGRVDSRHFEKKTGSRLCSVIFHQFYSILMGKYWWKYGII
jgi:hypothetical protein